MGDTDNPFAVVRPSWVRWRIVALLLLFSFMSWFNRMSIQAAGDIHIIGHYHIDKSTFGFINTAFFLAYTLCMTPAGWLIDRVGAWRALVFIQWGFQYLTFSRGARLITGAVVSDSVTAPHPLKNIPEDL